MFIVQFTGGLGNQIFQYNFVKFLSERFPKAEIGVDTKSQYTHLHTHGKCELKMKRFRHYSVSGNHAYKTVNEKTYTGNYSQDEDILFTGYWQELRFFPEAPISFQELFGKIVLNDRNRTYQNDILGTECSIAVHIRRGDYVENFMHSNIATGAYFNNAAQYMAEKVPDACFFVFSDDLAWVKGNIHFGGSRVVYIEGNEAVNDKAQHDMFLMSLCRHYIISNSSFSFWAQQFNPNPQKIVVRPEYWFNEKIDRRGVATGFQEMPGIPVSNIPFTAEKGSNPFFSVVLTAYNQEDCIRRAVSSVLNQSFQEFELIVVDDGSSDNTRQVLLEYEEHNAKISVVTHSQNSSQHIARMSGVVWTHAPYIVFLDGDDYFREGAFEMLYQKIKETPGYDFYEFGYMEQPQGNVRFFQDSLEDRFSAFFTNGSTAPTVWNKVYSSPVVKRAFGDMEKIYLNGPEDAYESIVIAYYAKNILRLDCVVTNYIWGTGVSTKKKNVEQIKEFVMYIGKTLQCINDFLVKKEMAEQVSIRILELHFLDFIRYTFIETLENEGERESVFLNLADYFSADCLAEYLYTIIEKGRKPNPLAGSKEMTVSEKVLVFFKRVIKFVTPYGIMKLYKKK